jgi:hypothetical protein
MKNTVDMLKYSCNNGSVTELDWFRNKKMNKGGSVNGQKQKEIPKEEKKDVEKRV